MSFMSFDYAQRAADAALQFHQGQGQKMQETNSQMRDVGNRNANSKDETMRQKIQAEYEAKSAEIKEDRLEQMAAIKQKRFENAVLAQFLVLGGTVGGGVIDGLIDTFSNKDQAPDVAQMNVDSSTVDDNYATSFKIANGQGNSEQGAIVAFDQSQGQFNVVAMNTSSGQVQSFHNVSASQMADNILNTLTDGNGNLTEAGRNPNNAALLSKIDVGPPAMFKADHFGHGVDPDSPDQVGMSEELRNDLFGQVMPDGSERPGFFTQGSRIDSDGNQVGTESGENMIRDMLGQETAFRPNQAYTQTGNSIMALLGNERIQNGLQITDDATKQTRDSLEDSGINLGSRFGERSSTFLQKAIIKPLGEGLNQFMKMAQVTKQYEEEYEEAVAQYNEAKKQAANARKRLQQLESLLAAGASS